MDVFKSIMQGLKEAVEYEQERNVMYLVCDTRDFYHTVTVCESKEKAWKKYNEEIACRYANGQVYIAEVLVVYNETDVIG